MDLPKSGAPKPQGAMAGPAIMDLPSTGAPKPIGATPGAAKEIEWVPTTLVAIGAAKGAPINPALVVAMAKAARTN